MKLDIKDVQSELNGLYVCTPRERRHCPTTSAKSQFFIPSKKSVHLSYVECLVDFVASGKILGELLQKNLKDFLTRSDIEKWPREK